MAAEGPTAQFLLDAMVDDLIDRLGFLRHAPEHVFAEGPGRPLPLAAFGTAAMRLDHEPLRDFDHPLPYQSATYDLVISLGSLGTLNDPVGALIQMRELLLPGGLAMASFVGGQSLSCLRRAMFEAEPERPAARMHPLVDPRSCPQLLARAGWADPVVDSYRLTVRYPSLDRLVQDLREHAMGNVLASPAPALTRQSAARAREAFLAQADDDGKVSETFEIITLTGRRSARRL